MPDDAAIVEKVARAICDAEGIDPDERMMSKPTIYMMTMEAEWNDSTDIGAEWEEWVPHAEKAIAAYRDAVAGGKSHDPSLHPRLPAPFSATSRQPTKCGFGDRPR